MNTEPNLPGKNEMPAPRPARNLKPLEPGETDPFKKSQLLPALPATKLATARSLPPADEADMGNFYHL